MEQIKKYIRGHKEKGLDVIAELEKLGGKNILKLKGNEYDALYYISTDNYIFQDRISAIKEKSFAGQLILTHPEWEEIKLLEQFKDGDVVFYDDNIAIFKEWGDKTLFRTYVKLFIHRDSIDIDFPLFGRYVRKETRLATLEEKERLFKTLKDNGYRWNAEKKELEKLIEPKFKVGDRIRHRLTGDVYKVLFVLSNGCGGGVYDVAITNEIGKSIDVKEQDDYELVPNKFDISTLVPFESRVLVRDYESHKWSPAIWGLKTDDIDYSYIVVGGIAYCQCIPFEGNEYLLGKYDDCDEYYKTWEEL